MSLIFNIKNGDWASVRQAISKLGSTKLGPTSTPTFSNLILNGTATTGLDMSGGTFDSDIDLTVGQINRDGIRFIKEDDVDFNAFYGTDAFNNDDGQYNVGIGYHAGYNNSTSGGGNNGTFNVYIGYGTGEGDSGGATAYSNIAVGAYALRDITSGYNNAVVGAAAMRLATTSYQCMAFGDGALYSCTDGHDNVAVGYNTGNKITTGDNNTLIGTLAGYSVTTNSNNVAIGANTWDAGTGAQNTIIGTSAASAIVGGDDNVIIGTAALAAATSGTGNIFIGRNSGRRQSGDVDNRLMFDNQDRTTAAAELISALLVGTMSSTVADQELIINGALKVGNATTGQECLLGDGGTTDYTKIDTNGDVTFNGAAGFYPRVLDQSAEPAAGTGATQCDTGEAVVWTDTDDSKCYLCYNHGGTVKTVELV